MNILIVEDEMITAMDLKQTLEKRGHTIQAICKTYNETMSSLQSRTPDIVLIDIKLKLSTLDGIKIAEKIKEQSNIPIIYLTSQTNYETFERAKSTEPVAFLFKPFRQQEVAFQIELAYNHYKVNQSAGPDPITAESVFLPYLKGHQKIQKKQILFIKAEGAYTNIFVKGEKKPLLFTMNIGYISQFFPSPDFYRLSRSYLINIQHISRFDSENIYFDGSSEKIPIPQIQRAEFLKKIALIKTSVR